MFKSNSFFILLCISIANPLLSTIYYPDNKEITLVLIEPKKINPQFDVDGVVVNKLNQIIAYTKLVLKPDEHVTYVKKLQLAAWCWKNRGQLRMLEKKTNGFAILKWIAQHNPCLDIKNRNGISFVDRIKVIEAGGTPIKGTIDIVNQLKKQGYIVSIATNRERESFDYLTKHNILPAASEYAHIHTPDYGCNEYNSETFSLESNEQQSLFRKLPKKPDAEYYEGNQAVIKRNYPQVQHSIFIDDKKENVVGAVKEGLIGIHFTSAALLKNDLLKLGIQLDEKKNV